MFGFTHAELMIFSFIGLLVLGSLSNEIRKWEAHR